MENEKPGINNESTGYHQKGANVKLVGQTHVLVADSPLMVWYTAT